jgi:hypothetical protein
VAANGEVHVIRPGPDRQGWLQMSEDAPDRQLSLGIRIAILTRRWNEAVRGFRMNGLDEDRTIADLRKLAETGKFETGVRRPAQSGAEFEVRLGVCEDLCGQVGGRG